MYSRKKIQEDIPEVITKIWSCQSEDCNGWMRANFSFDHTPTCVLCQSPMTSEERMLPLIVNMNDHVKLSAVVTTAE